ncbi:MAG TPA: hypothetical protein VHU80_14610 [Polyangiaceae bacterium]|jgi:hypothetical protein|nr:hypothetical protein [Polyangiaceae bacterium]
MLKTAVLGGLGCFVLSTTFVACGNTNDAGSQFSQGVTGSRYPGAGTSFSGEPLQPGIAADTAGQCSMPPPMGMTNSAVKVTTACVYGDTNDTGVPAATIEEITEVVDDKSVIHVRITFDPAFVDNSYGQNAIGWGSTTAMAPATAPMMQAGAMGAKQAAMGAMPGGAMGAPKMMPMGGPGHGGHKFDDLVGSDHVEVKFTDKTGELKLHVAVDYISQDSTRPCGYGTLGVTGGEGKVFVGAASDVLAVATSLDRDLNGCGYCLTTDSPATDTSYTPNSTYPKWDYRVVYELWIDASTFGTAGFGGAALDFVHASPSKLGQDTVDVTPRPCPPDWNLPYCTPSLQAEGLDCGSTGGAGGSSGGGAGPVCPSGWVPDLQTEGRTCTKAPE